MSHPSRVRMTGPLAPFAHGFAEELARHGYRRSPISNQLQLIAHLSRWLCAQRLSFVHLTPPVLTRFLAARRSQGYVLWLSPKALAPFIDYLRSIGCGSVTPKTRMSPAEELLSRYRRYLLETRGLADASAAEYVKMVRPFIATRTVNGEIDWNGLKPQHLMEFVLGACRRRSRSSASLLTTALRGLLRYLHIEGLTRRALEAVVPSVPCSKLSGLPRSLEANEVERLLRACDRRAPTGRRDFAMLMLLARLGLRAGEVRALTLDDVDWRSGELMIRGKGGRLERLPLPVDVGNAVAAYIQQVRPGTAQGRTVFVRIHAPHRALTSAAVGNAVYMAASRAGLGRVSAHQLRHTVATQMIRAGVALPKISQVLRHRRLLTTAIYAKLDREGLRCVARRWPGGAA